MFLIRIYDWTGSLLFCRSILTEQLNEKQRPSSFNAATAGFHFTPFSGFHDPMLLAGRGARVGRTLLSAKSWESAQAEFFIDHAHRKGLKYKTKGVGQECPTHTSTIFGSGFSRGIR